MRAESVPTAAEPHAVRSGQRGDTALSIPDHQLIRRIGEGAYGEVWLARNVLGAYRAVKAVFRASFKTDEPYEREFRGIQRFEPISRSDEGLVDILQVGRNDTEAYFYYVMELADSVPASPGCEERVSRETRTSQLNPRSPGRYGPGFALRCPFG